jgi:type IV pilus assembly protein PilW
MICAGFKRPSDSAAIAAGGFTLVEILVAMVAASLLMAAVVGLFTALKKSYTKQTVAADVQQVVRAGIDFMAENIRMAGLDPAGTGLFGIEAPPGSNSIDFTGDMNLNGVLDNPSVAPDPAERISYYLDGGQVKQSANGSVEALVENVTDLTFTYYDADDLETAVAGDIRAVQISLTVVEPAGTGGTLQRTYKTRVKCRNLGL